MRCLSFFINTKILGKKLCVGTCLKCLTVATPLVHRPALATGDVDKIIEVIPKGIHHSVYRKKPIKTQIS